MIWVTQEHQQTHEQPALIYGYDRLLRVHMACAQKLQVTAVAEKTTTVEVNRARQTRPASPSCGLRPLYCSENRGCLCYTPRVGSCLYQSLVGILFVACETVTHLRRCGGTRLVSRELIIKLYVVSNLMIGVTTWLGKKSPSAALRNSTLLLLSARWLSGLRDFCLRE